MLARSVKAALGPARVPEDDERVGRGREDEAAGRGHGREGLARVPQRRAVEEDDVAPDVEAAVGRRRRREVELVARERRERFREAHAARALRRRARVDARGPELRIFSLRLVPAVL